MPLKVSDLAKKEKTVTLEYDGESVTVVYRPALLTPLVRLRLFAGPSAHVADLDTATAADLIPAVETYLEELAALLVRWDVVDGKGKPLAPSPALLESLPQDFVQAVVRALLGEVSANPPNGEVSPATSPQTA